MLQQTQGFSILTSLLGRGFRSSTIEVNGTALHYVRGGDGPAILLIHGFPQDWSEYHSIMPELARRNLSRSTRCCCLDRTRRWLRRAKSCRRFLSTFIEPPARLASGWHKMELFAISSRLGRRSLHRGRSILSDIQGRSGRLSPRDHSRRAATKRQHGRLCRFSIDQSSVEASHPCRRRESLSDGPHLQGKLPRFAQYSRSRHRA